MGSESGRALRMDPRDADAFWRNVDRSGDCWLWTGSCSKSRNGAYGFFYSRLTHTRAAAHRAAYAFTHGELPEGVVVMHSCDNPSCVKPTHLTLGTQRDNVRDAIAKGRAKRARHETDGYQRRAHAEALRINDIFGYLDYLHANLCGFAKALNIGPLPHDFETWRKARYAVKDVA